jgi:hypothetical protein
LETRSGGRYVGGKLKELEDALLEYFGALNMLQEGMKVDIPEKPEALEKYEQCLELGLPLVAGGLQDQPHIWLLEIGVIRNVLQIQALAKQNDGDSDARS